MKNSIRVERAKLEISQQELADRVLVTRQTIHSIEKGKKIPSVMLAIKIANIFKVKVEDIFKLK